MRSGFRPRRNSRANQDNLVLRRKELWFSVKTGAHKYDFLPGESGIPHLDRFAQIHENYQLRNFQVLFAPSAGTTIPGNITLGFDYSPANERKKDDIPLLNPNISGAIYAKSQLRLPVQKAMKGIRWLQTSSAGSHTFRDTAFALYVDSSTASPDIGQIWVSYTIAFTNATSPNSGPTPGKELKVNVVTSNQNLVSDAITSQADSTQIATEDQVPIKVVQPFVPTAITPDGTDYQCITELPQDLSVGSEFTSGSAISSDPTLYFARAQSTKPPRIHFKYSDGTDVPEGTILPLSKMASVSFNATSQESDIFATIFRLLKPLAKPLWSIVEQVVQPFIQAPSLDASPIYDQNTEQFTSFTFLGDEATISLPNPSRDSLSSRFPVTLLFTGGHGTIPSVKNYTAFFQYQLYSVPTSWVSEVHMEEVGSSNKTSAIISFAHPDKTTSAFQNGDIMTCFCNTIPMERGISSDAHMPFESPVSDSVLKDMRELIESSSSLSDTVGQFDKAAPRFKILEVTNKTNPATARTTNGLFFTGRFISLASEHTYKYAVFRFPSSLMLEGVPTSTATFFPTGTSCTDVFHKANDDYANALTFATFQFFPTAVPRLLSKTPENLALQRVTAKPAVPSLAVKRVTFSDTISEIFDDDESDDSFSESSQ